MIYVNRAGIADVVRAALLDGTGFVVAPSVQWRQGTGAQGGDEIGTSYERGTGEGGAVVWLSHRAGRQVGSDSKQYETGGGPYDFSTRHTMRRRFVLTIRAESDAFNEQSTAAEICEHLRTRLLERAKYIDAMIAIGHAAVASAGDITDAPSFWGGRRVTGAVLELVCLAERTEVDSSVSDVDGGTPGGGEFFNRADARFED